MTSERFLCFNGTNPMSHKRNVSIALIDRAIAFSHPEFRPESIKKVKSILNFNGYPKKFYDPIIKSRVNNYYNSRDKKKDTDLKYVSIPYIKGHSERLRKILNKHGFSVSFKTSSTLKKFYSKLKYKVKSEDKSNLIYKINCKNCISTYIGTTGQKLKNRVSQHKSDIKN